MSNANKEAVVKDMFKVGAHFGFSRARRHPSATAFIFGYKNKTAVIDLDKAADSLEAAKDFVRQLGSESKQILWVGNKSEAREVVKKAAQSIDMPFVAERWIGGTFTNFKQMKKRVERLVDLRDKTMTGGLSMYTKKERGVIAKEVENLERYFSSVVNMPKLPAAIFLVDVKQEHLALAEAKQLGITVISLSGSDCDVSEVDYAIIANDASRSSIAYFVGELVKAYANGKANPVIKEVVIAPAAPAAV